MSIYAADSERLWLQSLNIDEHLDDYFEIMSNPKSMEWSRGSYHTDIQETATLILESQPTPEEPWNVRYAILLRPGPSIRPTEANSKPKMIGVLGTPRELEVAYKLHPCYWGKGYMSEALAMFIKLYWQFDGGKPNTRLLAHADPENVASNRVLEKAGFQKGEVKKGYYERSVFKGIRKSDLQSYYLERPKDC